MLEPCNQFVPKYCPLLLVHKVAMFSTRIQPTSFSDGNLGTTPFITTTELLGISRAPRVELMLEL